MHKFDGNYTVHGHKVSVAVSPCSWMYPRYGFQIGVTDETKGTKAFIHDKKIMEPDAKHDDVLAMLDTLTADDCKCGKKFLRGEPDEYQKVGQCETCRIAAIDAEFAKANKKEEALEKRRDARAKKQGFKYKLVAWVHPKAGGDDYQLVVHSREKIAKAKIEEMLKKRGSAITTDYTVTDL